MIHWWYCNKKQEMGVVLQQILAAKSVRFRTCTHGALVLRHRWRCSGAGQGSWKLHQLGHIQGVLDHIFHLNLEQIRILICCFTIFNSHFTIFQRTYLCSNTKRGRSGESAEAPGRVRRSFCRAPWAKIKSWQILADKVYISDSSSSFLGEFVFEQSDLKKQNKIFHFFLLGCFEHMIWSIGWEMTEPFGHVWGPSTEVLRYRVLSQVAVAGMTSKEARQVKSWCYGKRTAIFSGSFFGSDLVFGSPKKGWHSSKFLRS